MIHSCWKVHDCAAWVEMSKRTREMEGRLLLSARRLAFQLNWLQNVFAAGPKRWFGYFVAHWAGSQVMVQRKAVIGQWLVVVACVAVRMSHQSSDENDLP